MKVIVIDQYGNVEELKEREVLKPIVKDNEVLIRILAFNEEGVREAHILSEGQHVRGKIVMKVRG